MSLMLQGWLEPHLRVNKHDHAANNLDLLPFIVACLD